MNTTTEQERIILTTTYSPPCGILLLGATARKLCLCDWQASSKQQSHIGILQRHLSAEIEDGKNEVLTQAVRQLEDYFAGRRQIFDIPMLVQGTPFQRLVWQALLQIPFGQTRSYAELATSIGHPTATRAVANACGANRMALFIPCHRVCRSQGALGGYAGGLVEVKEWLSKWEKIAVS